MLRRILPLLGMCLLASVSLRAQEEKVEVFGGYSYLHFHANPSTNLNGWEASGQYKITNWIGGVAAFDGHYGSFSGGFGTSTYTVSVWATSLVPRAGIAVRAPTPRRRA